MEETPTEDEGRKSDDEEEKKEKEAKEGDAIPELAPVEEAPAPTEEAPSPTGEAPGEEEVATPPAEEAPTEEAPAPTEDAPKDVEESPDSSGPQEPAPSEESGGEDDYKMPTPQDVKEAPKDEGGGDAYEMPTLQEVEKKEDHEEAEASLGKESTASQGDVERNRGTSSSVEQVLPEVAKEDDLAPGFPETEEGEEEHIDLDAHDDIKEHTKCPKCEKDYFGPEDFCTNCGAQVVKTRESVQSTEEIPKVKAEASGEGNVYKAPALEWHDDEPRTFEVACYNCNNVFDATVEKVPAIINCPTCQAQLQIEEIPPEEDEDEDDEEDLEITAKPSTAKKVKPPKKGCPQCGGKTRFIPRHFKWFCDTCQKWI